MNKEIQPLNPKTAIKTITLVAHDQVEDRMHEKFMDTALSIVSVTKKHMDGIYAPSLPLEHPDAIDHKDGTLSFTFKSHSPRVALTKAQSLGEPHEITFTGFWQDYP